MLKKSIKTALFLCVGALFWLFANHEVHAEELCADYLLLNGYEDLVSYGMDTTTNWWAITQPFSNKYRLTVNGEQSLVYDAISKPVFAPDGKRWAAFADANGAVKIITESEVVELHSATDFGSMVYSGNSNVLVYSYFEGINEIIVNDEHDVEVRNRIGDLYTNYNGSKVAFIGKRGGYYVLNVDGKETTGYDFILPHGFWYDDRFVYSVQYGTRWEIMRGDKPVGETYSSVVDGKVNLMGTVGAFLVGGYDGRGYGILLSDDYYEPLLGASYEQVSDLALHPYLALYAYKARYQSTYYVVYNTTEYYAGTGAGAPFFSADGNDLSFVYQTELDSYFSNNGVRGFYPSGSNVYDPVAHAPNSSTYAFTNGTNLVMRYSDKRNYHACSMVDYTSQARYNRVHNCYEALGVISNKLYLLTITVPDTY